MGEWRFEIYMGGMFRRKWFWRLRAGNGEIVAQSEGYSRKIDAIRTIESVQERAPHASLHEVDR